MPYNEDGSRKSGFKMKGNPIQRNFGGPLRDKDTVKESKVTTTYNKDGGITKSDGTNSQVYTLNPNYDKNSARTGNFKYLSGKKDANGNPIGTNN